MIADCETCERKQVPCKSCQESQRAICYRCNGDVDDPYCELDDDWHRDLIDREPDHGQYAKGGNANALKSPTITQPGE